MIIRELLTDVRRQLDRMQALQEKRVRASGQREAVCDEAGCRNAAVVFDVDRVMFACQEHQGGSQCLG